MRSTLRLLTTTTLLVALCFPLLGAGPGGAKRPEIKWGSDVNWQTWDEGSKLAAKEGKPIVLVVYADWCPRCRELAPVFKTPEIVALTKDLVMVLQDSDAKPAWLKEKYGATGSYVPRILFLNADGTLRTDLTSGNGKYPFYYWPGNEHIAGNLKKVLVPAE